MDRSGPESRQTDRPERLRRGTIGLAVGVGWIAALFAVAPLVGSFGIVGLAQELILRAPGWLATAAIDALGFSAQPLLVVGVVAAVLAATTLAAIVWPRDADRLSPAAVAAGVIVTAWLFLATGTALSVRFVLALVVAVGVPSLAARLLTGDAAPADRRAFLRRVGTVAGAGIVSAGALRFLFDRFVPSGGAERAGEPLPRPAAPPTGDPAFDVDGMPAAITPPGDHYVVDINIDDPTVDTDSWTLDIDGAVEEPYSLAYDDLLEHEARVEQPTTLLCISNRVGGDLIGTGHWTGVPLSDLIDDANPDGAAVDVVTHAVDGYSEAVPIDLVEREDVLIAYGMGRRTLTPAHGFPARLLVPGRYGMKMTKWITRIEVSEGDHEAYWAERGWTEEAVVNTASYVRGAERTGDEVVIGGVAFGGLETGVEELSGVEVSVDDGETWAAAELEAQLAPHAWRRWRYAFDAPNRSEFDVVVRAVERDGTVQTAEKSDPVPSGATGWHRTTVDV